MQGCSARPQRWAVLLLAVLGVIAMSPAGAAADESEPRATIGNRVRVNRVPLGLAYGALSFAALPARDVVHIGSTAPNLEVTIRRRGVEVYRTTATTHVRRPGEPRVLGKNRSPPSGCPCRPARPRSAAQSGGAYTGFSAGSSCETVQARVDRQPPSLKVLWVRPVDASRSIIELRIGDDLRVADLSVKSGTGPWESAGLAPITGRFRHGKTIGGWYYLERGDDGWSISLTVRGRAGRIVRLRAADGAGHRVHAQLQQPCLPGLAALCQ